MRRNNTFGCCYRPERCFLNEAQFLKFSKSRDRQDLTNLICARLSPATNEKEASGPAEPAHDLNKAKGVSA
jgi:hypothetical protein